MAEILLFPGVRRATSSATRIDAPKPAAAPAPASSLDHYGAIPLNAAYHYAPAALRDKLMGAADRTSLTITAGTFAALDSDTQHATLSWLAGYQNASVMDVVRFLKAGDWHRDNVVRVVKEDGNDVAIEGACRRAEAHLYCVCQMLAEGPSAQLKEALARADTAPLTGRPQRMLEAYDLARVLARG